MLLLHAGRWFGPHGGPGWWGVLGGLLPLVLLALLVGLVVWAVLRPGRGPGPAPAGPPIPPGPLPGPDAALEELRLRYARGELSREEFLQRSSDLRGPGPGPSGAVPPEAS